jgi:hypothetical protein
MKAGGGGSISSHFNNNSIIIEDVNENELMAFDNSSSSLNASNLSAGSHLKPN